MSVAAQTTSSRRRTPSPVHVHVQQQVLVTSDQADAETGHVQVAVVLPSMAASGMPTMNFAPAKPPESSPGSPTLASSLLAIFIPDAIRVRTPSSIIRSGRSPSPMPTMLPPAAMSPPMVSPPNSPVTGARQRPGQTELPLTQQLGAVLGPGDLPTPSLPTPSQDIMGPLHPPPHTLPPPTLMPSPLPTPPLSAAPLTPNANGHASPPPQHPRVNLTLRDHSDDTPISPTVEAPDTLGGTWWRLGAGAGGSDVQLTNGQTSASILSPPRDTRPPTNQQSPPEGPNGTARSRSPSWWGLGALALVGAATTSASPANPANGSPPQAPTTPGTSSPPNTRGPTWPSLSALLTPSLLNPNPMTTSLSPPVTTFNPARSYRRPPSPSPVRLPTLSVSSLVASEAAKSKLGTAWRERSRSRGRTGALIGGAAFVVDRTLEREGRGDTGGAERDRNDDGAGGAGAASGTWWL